MGGRMRPGVTLAFLSVLACHANRASPVPASASHTIQDALPLRQYAVRIVSGDLGELGTGFIHVSGRVLTAHHVVARAESRLQIQIGERRVGVKDVVFDEYLDIAILTAEERLEGGLRVAHGKDFAVGNTVVTWGYPLGYAGSAPLLTVGYLSGLGTVMTPKGPALRSYINGTFNLGNSGGPLIDLQDLAVVGMVNAKMAPMPPKVRAALKVLQTA
jgi:S1-C subfamily serine protease